MASTDSDNRKRPHSEDSNSNKKQNLTNNLPTGRGYLHFFITNSYIAEGLELDDAGKKKLNKALLTKN